MMKTLLLVLFASLLLPLPNLLYKFVLLAVDLPSKSKKLLLLKVMMTFWVLACGMNHRLHKLPKPASLLLMTGVLMKLLLLLLLLVECRRRLAV